MLQNQRNLLKKQCVELTGNGFLVEGDLHRVGAGLVRREAGDEALIAERPYCRRDATPIDEDFQISRTGL